MPLTFRPRISRLWSAVIVPFSANFARDLSMPVKPRSHSSLVTLADDHVEPGGGGRLRDADPIRPQPSTPTFLISQSASLNLIFFASRKWTEP